MAEIDKDAARRILAAAGRRTTAQRALILEVLRNSSGHLDADQVYRLARERDPHVSLSTVYRTLSLLRELGQVEELHLAEEHHHYEAKGVPKPPDIRPASRAGGIQQVCHYRGTYRSDGLLRRLPGGKEIGMKIGR